MTPFAEALEPAERAAIARLDRAIQAPPPADTPAEPGHEGLGGAWPLA
jgi:hypothetical protein